MSRWPVLAFEGAFVDEVRKPGACLTGGWRSNGHQGQFMVRLWLLHQLDAHFAKAPDRGTVRRSPGGFALIPG